MTYIPEDYTEFLLWVKETTEAYWAQLAMDDPQNWAAGARWIGMTEEQIDATEEKYQIRFTPEHRAFLCVLHTPDRKVVNTYECEDGTIDVSQTSFFHNWLEDEAELVKMFEWPLRTIFQDVQGVNYVWLKQWGHKPGSETEQKAIVAEWIHKAPKLIPVTGHRFAVSDMQLPVQPVLSVLGADIIVYGDDFKLYLLNELEDCLPGLTEQADYDEEYDSFDYEDIPALKAIKAASYERVKDEQIPYWQDLILYYTPSRLWTKPV